MADKKSPRPVRRQFKTPQWCTICGLKRQWYKDLVGTTHDWKYCPRCGANGATWAAAVRPAGSK